MAEVHPLFWEDVSPGTGIPPVMHGPIDLQTVIRFAAASDDFAPVHFDSEYCKTIQLADPILHGPFKSASLAKMLTNWAHDPSALKELLAMYRRMNFVGDTLICKGVVKRKYESHGSYLVECEIVTEALDGVVTTTGEATVQLPSRTDPSGTDPFHNPVKLAPRFFKEDRAMTENVAITDEQRRLVGWQSAPWKIEIEKGAVRRYAAAIFESNPVFVNQDAAANSKYGSIIAPPLFFCPDTLILEKRPRFNWTFKYTTHGTDYWQIIRPVYIGDVLTGRASISDVYQKSGGKKTGRMIFIRTETIFHNQRGELVGRTSGTHINYEGRATIDGNVAGASRVASP